MGGGGEFSRGGGSSVVFPEDPGHFFLRKAACDSIATRLIY